MYTFIFSNYLYPIFNKLIGRDFLPLAKQRIVSSKSSIEVLEALRLSKGRAVISNAVKFIPYYRINCHSHSGNSLKEETVAELAKLNFFISKKEIREATDQFISDKCNRTKLNWHKTGGSTGEPLLFATDRLTDTASASALILALNWWGARFGSRHAMFWGSPQFIILKPSDHFKKHINWFRNILMNRYFISNYDLNDDNMALIAQKLVRWGPVYIRGMPSSLFVFARYVLQNNINLNLPKLKIIFSACEQLFDWQKTVIEQAFNCRVANTYGLSEVGDVAYEAPCGNMHILDEDIHVELVESGLSAKEIVVTQLNNLSTPLIRYRTGDLADSIDACDCGINLRVLHGLKGRAHDLIVSPEGRFLHGQIFTHILVNMAGVIKYQVVQHRTDLLEIVLVVSDEYDSSSEILIRKAITTYMGQSVEVVFTYAAEIPLTAAGKHRWIVSKLNLVK